MLGCARNAELVCQLVADQKLLTLGALVALGGGAANKIERGVPVLRAANASGGENGAKLQRIGILLARRRGDQSCAVARRGRYTAADEQACAELVLRARVACECTLLQ